MGLVGRPQADGPRGRVRLFAPYLAMLAAAFASCAVVPAHDVRPAYLIGAGALGGVLLMVLVATPWGRLPQGVAMIGIALFCADVFLLREATGGTASGFLLLLLVPVMFEALYGRRRDIVAALLLTSATTVAPIVLIGAPRYPTSEWRRTIVYVMVACLLAAVVHRLVESLRRGQFVLHAVGAVSRTAAGVDDARGVICEACTSLLGADVAMIVEVDGPDLVVTGCAGRPLVLPWTLPTGHQEVARRVLDTGQPVLLQDLAEASPLGLPGGDARFGALLLEPLHRGEDVIGLLWLAWAEPGVSLDDIERQGVELLAAETVASLQRAALVQQLNDLARHDPLTGLANRRAWDERVDREIAGARRTGNPLSVALIDLDHFKRFNDANGHLAGDRLLKEAAAAWSSRLRSPDLLVRWGGEEFAVLLPGTGAATAGHVLARLLAATPSGQTFSAGVAQLTPGTGAGHEAMIELIAVADQAVYRAKARGRNRIELAHGAGVSPG